MWAVIEIFDGPLEFNGDVAYIFRAVFCGKSPGYVVCSCLGKESTLKNLTLLAFSISLHAALDWAFSHGASGVQTLSSRKVKP